MTKATFIELYKGIHSANKVAESKQQNSGLKATFH